VNLHRTLVILVLTLLGVGANATDADRFGGTPDGPVEDRFLPRPGVAAVRPGNLRLTSVLTAQGSPFAGTTFTVLREEPDAFGKTRYRVMATSGPQAEAVFSLGPGRYRIQARNGAVTTDDLIQVPSSGFLRHDVVLNAGQLHLSGLMTKDGPVADETWFRVLREDADAYGQPVEVQVAGNGYAPDARFVLPAGDYVAEATYGDARVALPVRVTAGRVTDQAMVLDAGRLELSGTLDAFGEGAIGTTFRVYRRTDPGSGASRWQQVAQAEPTDQISFILPSGEYRVSAELDLASAQTTLTLAAGETLAVELPLEAGELRLLTTLSGDDEALLDARFSVRPSAAQDAGGSAATAPRGPQPEARFVLPAGSYLATARVGESEHSVAVEVAPGSRQTAVIPQDAGRVRLALTAPQRDQRSGFAWYSVYRVETDRHGRAQRRRVFNDGYYSEADLVLPAGRYIAFASQQAQRGELVFDVRPGEIRTLFIVAGN
jgi:hypothetical protein